MILPLQFPKKKKKISMKKSILYIKLLHRLAIIFYNWEQHPYSVHFCNQGKCFLIINTICLSKSLHYEFGLVSFYGYTNIKLNYKYLCLTSFLSLGSFATFQVFSYKALISSKTTSPLWILKCLLYILWNIYTKKLLAKALQIELRCW